MKKNVKLTLKQYVKMFAQNCLLPLWYDMHKRKPVIPELIIFADAHHDSRPENMQLLYEGLAQSREKDGKIQIVEMYLNYQKASPVKVLRHMLHFMKLYAQASCVVLCDNFLPSASCRKRKETKVIQLW
ncbi:MAG: CDP-glycerol glycerophosphotransferase family protein, partial [Clostridia bacterium]|nr:CDP-glycerol glycerophosphotransferase family protein [Clostridia bacterium]MDY5554570.1 CDP-glycerol glycerophosphotransferase family protein [Blautia sp.]